MVGADQYAARRRRSFRVGLITISLSHIALLFLCSCTREPPETAPLPESLAKARTPVPAAAEPSRFFRLPTPNLALLDPDTEDHYFVGTPGRSWTSGMFGCVRSEGYQLHEGLDIRWVNRDAHGEATDSITAAADGTVVYVNSKPSLSNYGIYVILRHKFQGWELFTLYAHMARVDPGTVPGRKVQCGQAIGVMGRTSNTRSRISADRSHLHFEIGLLINDRFPDWQKRHYPGQRNDHGVWNGRNLLGIDPRAVFLQQYQDPASFDFRTLLLQQPILCRVLVRRDGFSWLDRYPATVQSGFMTNQTKIVAYELNLSFQGMPLQIIPKSADDAKGWATFQLLEVNGVVARTYPCQKLVQQRGGRWQLTTAGELFLDLLTF